jgi:molecular chaperone HtpG
MLQQSRQVKLIASGLEKKITAELTKMLEEKREDYEKMFSEFGLTLKFGAYNGFGAKKDQLKDLLLFYTSLDKKYATLSEYVKRMKDGQEFIYYATGEDIDKIDKMPQTEQAKKKGFEILYLKDNVDEFVLKVLDSYEEKKFKSVSEAGFSFDSEEEKQELSGKQEESKELIDFIKESLGDKVKEVKLNNLPEQYMSCLTSGGEISIEMEKVLNAMPNANGKIVAEKVLEINANHPVLAKIKSVFATDKEQVKKYAEVLYSSARVLEGLPLDDVTDFVATLSTLL